MFSKHEMETLALILRARDVTLRKICEDYFNATYGKHNVFAAEEYVYAAGDIPILLVAHLDTVFPKAPIICTNKEQTIWYGKDGLGADDRAGVFAILQLIKKNSKKPSVLFTMGEELGGFGAMSFVKDFLEPPVPTKYIVEIDRRGKGQSVYYGCGNEKFETYINSFGFNTYQGIFSDISFICPIWNVAGVNLSAGYYNEHTELETLKLEDLEYTKNKVAEMLIKSEEAPYFMYEPKPSAHSRYTKCSICGSIVSDIHIIPVGTGKDKTNCCLRCVDKYVDWCDICGEPFFVTRKEETAICEECANELRNDQETI